MWISSCVRFPLHMCIFHNLLNALSINLSLSIKCLLVQQQSNEGQHNKFKSFIPLTLCQFSTSPITFASWYDDLITEQRKLHFGNVFFSFVLNKLCKRAFCPQFVILGSDIESILLISIVSNKRYAYFHLSTNFLIKYS